MESSSREIFFKIFDGFCLILRQTVMGHFLLPATEKCMAENDRVQASKAFWTNVAQATHESTS